MFLLHRCHVLFHHPFILHSKARLSKIIPAFQVPRNRVYDPGPSAVSERLGPQMSLAVLQCAQQYFLFSQTCLEALKVTFFVPSPAASVSICCTVVQTALKIAETLAMEGKITLTVVQCWCCASTCIVLSPTCSMSLTCSALLFCHVINLLIAQPLRWCENFKSPFLFFAFCDKGPYLKREVESFTVPWKRKFIL